MKLLAKIMLLVIAMPLWADMNVTGTAPASNSPADNCLKMLGADQAKCNQCMMIQDASKKQECLNGVMSDMNSSVTINPPANNPQ